MITRDDVDRVRRSTAHDEDGHKLGKVGEVYLDNDSGAPAWVTVSTGLFGTRQSFVPLDGASLDGDDLRLPHSKSVVKDAPTIDDDESLTPQAEQELYRHYGLPARGDDEHRGDRTGGDRTGGDPRRGDEPRVDEERGDERPGDGAGGHGRDAAAAGAAGVAGVATGAAAQGHGRDAEHDGPRDEVRRDERPREGGGPVDGGQVDDGRERDRRDERDQREGAPGSGGVSAPAGPRLRKHTVTEMQTITVPVQKEVYTLEDEDGTVHESSADPGRPHVEETRRPHVEDPGRREGSDPDGRR